jgi:hypothetical protein
MISELVGYSSIGMAYFITVMCFLMAKRYSSTISLGRAFVYLGLAFAFYGTAELVWYHLDMMDVEPYQNYPDFFYIGYYLFAILHVVETLRYFSTKCMTFQNWEKAAIILVIFIVIQTFILITHHADDWAYGMVFAGGAATLGILALLGVIRVFFTKLSFTWILIGTSIMIASFVDIQYYLVETTQGYVYGQYPVIDITWFVTDIIMVVAIVFHKRAI